MTTEILFVRLEQRDKARHLCRLAEDHFACGRRILIKAEDPDQALTLDRYLWAWKKDSFLPHVVADSKAGDISEPIVITVAEVNPNNAQVLLCGHPCSPSFAAGFQWVYDFAELYDPVLADLSRQRFRHYRALGFDPQLETAPPQPRQVNN